MTTSKRAPTWIVAVSGLLALLGVGFTLGVYRDPQMLFATATRADPMLASWAVRNLATAVVLGVAALSRRADFLAMGLLGRVVTELGDGLIATRPFDAAGVAFPVVMLAVEIPALAALRRAIVRSSAPAEAAT